MAYFYEFEWAIFTKKHILDISMLEKKQYKAADYSNSDNIEGQTAHAVPNPIGGNLS